MSEMANCLNCGRKIDRWQEKECPKCNNKYCFRYRSEETNAEKEVYDKKHCAQNYTIVESYKEDDRWGDSKMHSHKVRQCPHCSCWIKEGNEIISEPRDAAGDYEKDNYRIETYSLERHFA
jgi:RecJ-like exonuclease